MLIEENIFIHCLYLAKGYIIMSTVNKSLKKSLLNAINIGIRINRVHGMLTSSIK